MIESKTQPQRVMHPNLLCPLHETKLTLEGQWCLECDKQYSMKCWWCEKKLSGEGQFCSMDCTSAFSLEQKRVQARQHHQVLYGRQKHLYGKCTCPFKSKGSDHGMHLGDCPALITGSQQGQVDTYIELMREVKHRNWHDVVYDYWKCDRHETAFRFTDSCAFCDPEIEERRKRTRDLYAELYRAVIANDKTLADQLRKKIKPFGSTEV